MGGRWSRTGNRCIRKAKGLVASSFLDPRLADSEGLVGITQNITPQLLLEAYQRGIFPWSDRPAYWYSPDPRAIFELPSVHIPKRIRRMMRGGRYEVSFDRAFSEVMRKCMAHHWDSWISPPMIEAYTQFHRMGCAHSVEVWRDGVLVGGLYGVQTGAVFAGESMFNDLPDCSKIAFAHLVDKLQKLGVLLIDAQVLSEHTARLGAVEISRAVFLDRLEVARRVSIPLGSWSEV